MELSVVIITKNERGRLRTCLKALQGFDFEIVVVDTGSTDGTKEMALAYTDKIFDFEWQDDFSLARNYAASKASHDMIMMLDSDEYVEEMDPAALERAVSEHIGMVGRIRRINLLERGENGGSGGGEQQEISEYISRIYDRRRYRYEGRIHEQITLIGADAETGGQDHRTYRTGVVVRHDGYCGSGDELRAKVERNIALLERELEEKKEDPYLCYQLGKSYFVAKDYTAAVGAFERSLCQDLNPKLEYVVDMVQAYGYSLLKSGQAARALSLEGIYEEFGDTADFRFLMGLVYMNNGLFDRAVEMFLNAAKAKEAYTKGVNSFLAYYNAGVICECLGNFEDARKYYTACGDYPRARQRLLEIG